MGNEPETKANNNASKRRDDDEPWFNFIYNSEEGKLLGRTGTSWAKIFIFYCIFYTALGAFAWLCYYLFAITTLKENEPRWILDSSIIGTNPGIGFRPMPDQETNSGSSLIWYRREVEADAAVWYNQLKNYTDGIENPKEVDSLQVCTYENGKRATKTKACRVDVNEFGNDCTKKNKFGYVDGEPCILIKLNRIFAWKPQPFGIDENGQYDSELLEKDLNDDDQKDMPSWLRKHITDGVKRESNKVSFLDTVWISCEGENIGDQENIGPVNYYPRPGIAGYFFPYSKQQGYQSPFIFVKLMKPKLASLINVECRGWAKNIKYDKHNRLGSVHFEMLID